MAATERYTAREPGLVWTLADLGIIDGDQAERNENRWWYEWDHLEELWAEAEQAWKALPLWTRLKLGFSPGAFSWKVEWRRQNDPWREGGRDGQD
jgi:hypothetical protein